ncbi:MAG: hypothetical protein KGV51_01595 [Moraxellaceae bacterium]|nr:hypothetical protein [Moraxellaceae bacterium]
MSLNKFVIERNEYLERDIQGFYRTDYVGYKKPSNPDYINTLKNTYNSISIWELSDAKDTLLYANTRNPNYLKNELVEILKTFPNDNIPIVICVVPRARANNCFHKNQLLFRRTIGTVINELIENNSCNHRIINGVNFIQRHTSTRTTHLPREMPNYDNSGDDPYIGISKDTCNFSDEIQGNHVLLIDDIYTKNVNIDEDCLQVLIDMGCQELKFFAIAKTVKKY